MINALVSEIGLGHLVVNLVGAKVLKEPNRLDYSFELIKKQGVLWAVIENVEEILVGLRIHAGPWRRLIDEIRRPTAVRGIICTARRPELLKPEEIEAFVHVLPFLYPDEHDRHDILKVHTRDLKLDGSINLAEIASRTEWWSGEELKELVDRAASQGAPTKNSFASALKSIDGRVVVEARKERMAELLKFTMKFCTSRALREETRVKFSGVMDDLVPQMLHNVPSIVFQSGANLTQIIKELNMDSYKTGDVYGGVVGGHVHDINFTQSWSQLQSSVNLPILAEQLSRLRGELLKRAADAEHHAAIGAVASAEIEAKKGDGPKALEYLSRAGKWVFDVAVDIGERVAAEAIKGVLT